MTGSPLRVVVTGINGQLGGELMRLPWPGGTTLIGLDRSQLDLSQPSSVASVIAPLQPDIIINAAAFTAVDLAEDNEEIAFAVNAESVAALAAYANESGARLLHVSTDYVFDGSKTGWYSESDEVAPLGVYGRSKRAGEEAALTAPNTLVFRTAWVYGALGNNFVRTMLRLASQRDTLGVVADQTGCPTSAADLATALIEVVGRVDDAAQQLYHLASPTDASWHEFATAILADAIESGRVVVNPLTTAEFPTPTARPANSRLDSSAATRDFGVTLPAWRESMPIVRDEIVSQLEET